MKNFVIGVLVAAISMMVVLNVTHTSPKAVMQFTKAWFEVDPPEPIYNPDPWVVERKQK